MSKKATPTTPYTPDQFLKAGKQIVDLLKDRVFCCDGTPTCTVKKADGAFAKKPVLPSFVFDLDNVYFGKQNGLILGFKLQDREPEQYEFVELRVSDVEDVFPTLGIALMEALQAEGSTIAIDDFPTILAFMMEADKLAEEQKYKSVAENVPGWGMF